MEQGQRGLVYQVDPESIAKGNVSHSFILSFIGESSTVLDLGCATGTIGRELKKRVPRLVGIDIDEAAVRIARPWYDQVLVGDATSRRVMDQFEDSSFETIVMGDIVEHLDDPFSFVKGWAVKLREGGKLVISTPNLGHASVICSLLSGTFAYRETGILDHTHRKFFSLRSLLSLVLGAGLTPAAVKRVHHDLFETEIPVEVAKISPKLVSMLRECPESSTYQFVLQAENRVPCEAAAEFEKRFSLPYTPNDGEPVLSEYLSLMEEQRRELRDARQYIGELKDRIGEMEQQDKETLGHKQDLQEQIGSVVESIGRPRDYEPLSPCLNTYDILIPIYNAYDHVRTCVSSVLEHTELRHRVYLLDDASPDPRILPLLESFAAADPRVMVIPSEKNQGFVANVNRGFRLSKNNVVILNSDTEVSSGWLERMDRCLRSSQSVGIVSPLSNNATILSVPFMNTPNPVSGPMSIAELAKLVSRVSPRLYPRIPTAVGFCMLISRKVLERIGPFDTVFGMGYGEESDFCMRAWNSGFEVVCCDDAYVGHYGEASFGGGRQMDARRSANQKLLEERWPAYHKGVLEFCRENPLRQIQEKIYRSLTVGPFEKRPHVLQVIHNLGASAGTELHTRQIVDNISSDIRSTVVFPFPLGDFWVDMVVQRPGEHFRIVRVASENVNAEEFIIGYPAGLHCGRVERNLARLIASGGFDIVHFQHLIGWNSLRLPFIAKALGKKVVLTMHDYFLLCPEYNMLRQDLKPCGKPLADEHDEDCFRCLGEKRHSTAMKPYLMHEYLAERNELVRGIIRIADRVVVPSMFAKEMCISAWGKLPGDKIKVIPHGLELLKRSTRPERDRKLRVAFLGNLTERKGGVLLAEAAGILHGSPVTFEVFGDINDQIGAVASSCGIRLHGAYKHRDLPELLQRADIVLIASIWPETFCLTLSEAQAMGVPVIAPDIGAISERVVEGETGFLFAAGDPADLARKLLRLALDRSSLNQVIENLNRHRSKTILENALEYEELYRACLSVAEPSSKMVRSFLGVKSGYANDISSQSKR